MTSRKKNNANKSTTLEDHLDDCPFFDLKHLQHNSLNGFIKHPDAFFLKSRYMSLSTKLSPRNNVSLNSYNAFSFSSRNYRIPGSIIEVSISTVNETHKILGKVIASIQSISGYEIGMVLLHEEDCVKLRYIEQICFIDNKLLSSI